MNPLRKTIVGGAIVASTLAGGALGAALVNNTAGAQTSTSTTTADSSTSTPQAPPAAPDGTNAPNFDPTKGGHVGQNGTTEELLTGDQAEQAKAAALKAVPGGTIQRVETDAEGDVYEAHMLDANGDPVTVKFDANMNVVRTETGGPGGPGGRHGGQGQDQNQNGTTSSSASA